MPSLRTVRDTLASTVAEAVPDLHTYANVPESPSDPALIVRPRSADFMVAMGRGAITYVFDLIVLASRRDDDLAQYDLDEYLEPIGDKSVAAALWDARPDFHAVGMDVLTRGWSDYAATESSVQAALEVHVTTNPNE